MDNAKTPTPIKSFTVKKLVIALAVVGVAALAALYLFIIMPRMTEAKYSKALSLFENEMYAEAAQIFEKLGDYENASLKLSDAKMLTAAENDKKIYSPKIKDQYEALLETEINVGDTVKLGFFEQNGDAAGEKEEIEWIVLECSEDEALLISKYCIDSIPYNITNESVTWETSSLRKWLDTVFIATAFYDRDDFLISSKLENRNNTVYGTSGGSDTSDKVFIMSVEEAEKYFTENDSLSCAEPSQYAKENGIFTSKTSGTSWWWLRTPGSNTHFAAGVSTDGEIVPIGYGTTNATGGVRPMMRIKI